MIMKKVLLSLFVIILTTGMISAQVDRHRNQRGNGHRTHGNGNGFGHTKVDRPSNKTVHAPLDGGLLLALGGAGVAYYAARKKKKTGSV
jgi:hypothetical protein